MWIASKDFYYRDKFYHAGDEVPADKWPNREQLVKIRRIQRVGASTVEPPPVNIRELKRAELNEYALEHGIDDPTIYKTIGDLVKALEEDEPNEDSNEEETEETDTNNPPTGEEESEDTVETEDEDDLFADDSEDEISDVTT